MFETETKMDRMLTSSPKNFWENEKTVTSSNQRKEIVAIPIEEENTRDKVKYITHSNEHKMLLSETISIPIEEQFISDKVKFITHSNQYKALLKEILSKQIVIKLQLSWNGGDSNQTRKPAQCENLQITKDVKNKEQMRTNDNRTCKLCNKTFASKNGLDNHVNAIHKKLKPFQCAICQMKYRQKSQLESHIEYHHGTRKSYPCDRCPKSFQSKGSLKNHLNIKHNKNG